MRSATWWSLILSGIDAVVAGWQSPEYKNFFSVALPIAPIKQPKAIFTNNRTGQPIHYYEVDIKPTTYQVYPNLPPTRLVGYDGIVPGPTFMMTKGIEAIVRFINHGDRANSVHLHGSYSRAPFDGWAEDITEVGQYKDYYYPNSQNARTLWYHDHAVDHTAENAYFGQAGFYILSDPQELALGLPAGKYDVPMAFSSKRYNKDGSLWSPEQNEEDKSLYGDVFHVNGQPWPYMDVEPRKYRFRLLNAAVSRTFQLYFEDAAKQGTRLPFTVVSSDAGLLEESISTDNIYFSMAERWEIVFDFSNFAGKKLTMRNVKGFATDSDFDGTDRVMQFRVGNAVSSTQNNGPVPKKLRTVPYPPAKAGIDRSFEFHRSNGQWQINGVTFSQIQNRIMAKPQRGAIEVWELENSSGGWSHPIHIHLVDFQILKREGGKRERVEPYERPSLKDVVWLGPNEKVTVIARYAPWDGVYMFHCHNLIHEDHEMMAAFNVTALKDFGYHETTSFIDPMEERYRARPIRNGEFVNVNTFGAGEFSRAAIQGKVDFFASLDAYSQVDEVDAALEAYWSRTTLSSSVRLASSTAPATFTTSVMRSSTVTLSRSTSTSSRG